MNVRGIAAPYRRRSVDGRVFAPHSLVPAYPCRLVAEHDDDDRLAWSADGGLSVWSNDEGLCFEARVSERIHDGIRWRTPLGCSVFMMTDGMKVEQFEVDGETVDRILSAKVIHIGLTHTPAFPDTACWSAADGPDDLPETARAIAARWSPQPQPVRLRAASQFPSARHSQPAPRMSSSGLMRARFPRAGRADTPRAPTSVYRVLALAGRD